MLQAVGILREQGSKTVSPDFQCLVVGKLCLKDTYSDIIVNPLLNSNVTKGILSVEFLSRRLSKDALLTRTSHNRLHCNDLVTVMAVSAETSAVKSTEVTQF